MLLRCIILACVFWVPAAHAVIETYQFNDPQLRERYQVLSNELRCPKCQNQNIAASNAPIAQDLRAQLHKQLQAGKSDDEILAFMVQRYGEFVLYRPRFTTTTAVLWLAPLLLLGLAVLLLWSTVLRSRNASAATGLQEAERQQLAQLLKEKKP